MKKQCCRQPSYGALRQVMNKFIDRSTNA